MHSVQILSSCAAAAGTVRGLPVQLLHLLLRMQPSLALRPPFFQKVAWSKKSSGESPQQQQQYGEVLIDLAQFGSIGNQGSAQPSSGAAAAESSFHSDSIDFSVDDSKPAVMATPPEDDESVPGLMSETDDSSDGDEKPKKPTKTAAKAAKVAAKAATAAVASAAATSAKPFKLPPLPPAPAPDAAPAFAADQKATPTFVAAAAVPAAAEKAEQPSLSVARAAAQPPATLAQPKTVVPAAATGAPQLVDISEFTKSVRAALALLESGDSGDEHDGAVEAKGRRRRARPAAKRADAAQTALAALAVHLPSEVSELVNNLATSLADAQAAKVLCTQCLMPCFTHCSHIVLLGFRR
jgi:trimeric autotransporter adhesin